MISVFDLLVYSQIPSIGANRLRSLVSYFKNTADIYHASASDIVKVEGFSKKLASEVVNFFKSSKFEDAKKYAEHQLSRLDKVGGKIISYWDTSFPDLLKKIYDPPPILFVKGDFREGDKYSLAIVGTRAPSKYGTTLAQKFSQEFAKLNLTIVSGLARGIDTIAHCAALQVGGRTFAVIGSGLDVLYPPENRNLAERIAKNGAVISEYEMGTKPDAVNFPRRNRIISGLALGTLIIETDVEGGAMITANTALDQNREIFALPGDIRAKKSRGCNLLIKNGIAKLVESIDDVIEELYHKLAPLLKNKGKKEPKIIPELTLFEKKIFDVLSDEPMHIDGIAEKSGMSTADALVNLLGIEFKGLIKQLPGKMFVKL